jgi:multicomponent Na+:H+ antiporter subunit F
MIDIDHFLATAGVLTILLAAPVFLRAVLGPTVIDRIVGVNLVGSKTTVLIIIIGAIYGRIDMFVDIALAYALLNFIVSLAAARYLQRYKTLDCEELKTELAD